MKSFILSLFMIPILALAEEERSLGKSPDGSFELLLRAASPDDYGFAVIKDISNGTFVDTDSGQGYSNFRTDDVHVTWKEDSSAFAISTRGSKTTTETDVYILDGQIWEKLVFPAFAANILGRQGVIDTGTSVNIDFGSFCNKSRFTILCHIEPDWQQKEAAEKITEWTPSKQTEWEVILEYHTREIPNCRILNIEPIANKRMQPTR